jgi:hypothetical protein
MIERPARIVTGGAIVYWVVASVALTPFVIALVDEAQAKRWLWLYFSLLLSPVGVLRGLIVLFRRT